MAKRHGAREQKRLAKQKAKREAHRRQLARRNSPDPMVRLKPADHWPIVGAWVPENLWELGMGNLIIARRMPDGHLACGLFLLDTFCMGVKNAFWRIVTKGEYDTLLDRTSDNGRLQRVSPEYFSKLVHCAADYGQSLGFPPHPDFRHARLVLAGIDPSQCHDEFEFGKDGKPFYIAGPHDSPDKIRVIMSRVSALGGHYTVPIDPADLPPGLHGFDTILDEESYEYDDEDMDEMDDLDAIDQANIIDVEAKPAKASDHPAGQDPRAQS